MDLDTKLEEFDRWAEDAVDFLLDLIEQERKHLIIQARGRLVEGHYRYADKYMFEKSPQELLGEISQEAADAINYGTCRLQKLHRQSTLHASSPS
jgi:hypothetical protein